MLWNSNRAGPKILHADLPKFQELNNKWLLTFNVDKRKVMYRSALTPAMNSDRMEQPVACRQHNKNVILEQNAPAISNGQKIDVQRPKSFLGWIKRHFRGFDKSGFFLVFHLVYAVQMWSHNYIKDIECEDTENSNHKAGC